MSIFPVCPGRLRPSLTEALRQRLFELSWGPEGEVFAVTSGEFQKNSKTIFGYAYDHPKMLPLREIFTHATTVYCYRLGSGAVKASNTLATAKYGGVRGNDITIVVAANGMSRTCGM